MLEYSEIRPPAALADTVDCFWTSNQSGDSPHDHLVVPDGCADLIFTRASNTTALQFVGPMTRFARFMLLPGQLCIAARFHPGSWTQLLQMNADLLTDRIVPLEALVPRMARRLSEQFMNETDPQQLVRVLAASIQAEPGNRLSLVLRHLARSSEHITLDSLASQVGLSTRHFRRCVRQQTGLSPKLLARILRFRHAAARLCMGKESHATLAAACGYVDQSHFIAEYRHFTGRTPLAAIASQPASARPPTRSPAALRQSGPLPFPYD